MVKTIGTAYEILVHFYNCLIQLETSLKYISLLYNEIPQLFEYISPSGLWFGHLWLEYFYIKYSPTLLCSSGQGGKKENLFKIIHIWIFCTSTEPITLFGDLHVCTATTQCSLEEWSIDTFLKVHFNILYRFVTVIFSFPNREFSSQYKSNYTEKYLSHIRP